MTVLRAGSATEVGLVRTNNQDTMLLTEDLFAVADGMGGHAAGEVASAAAVEALVTAWRAEGAKDPDALAAAAREANRQVWRAAQANPDLRGMGTTLVAVALTGSGDGEALAVTNVGDSRVYLLRAGELEQLTLDHSLVAELVAEGQLPPDEAEFHPQRHVLTRALGVDAEVEVDLLTLTPRPGDRLLLCSDGLIREVSDRQVSSLLRRLADPAEAAKELVAEAMLRGGNDNITVIVLDVVDDAAAEAGQVVKEAGDPTTALPTTALPPAGVAPSKPTTSRRAERRNARLAAAGNRPRARPVTLRVVGFVVLLAAVVGGAVAGLGWYARSTYYVGLRGGELTVYQGRPGGVLWFAPTVADRTGVTTTQVESRHLPELQAGVTESSLGAARSYVANLTNEYTQAQQAAAPTTTTTTTTPGLPTVPTTVASGATPPAVTPTGAPPAVTPTVVPPGAPAAVTTTPPAP